MDKIDIAKELGKQVAAMEPLTCPLCAYDDGQGHRLDRWKMKDTLQTMSSFGDYEDTLFCPHCDLTVELTVSDPGHHFNWVKSHVESQIK